MLNTSFEQLKCWQAARELVNEIHLLTNNSKIDLALKDQIRRASISIMSNIAEGYGRNGNKEFIQFLSIARGSAFEVHSQLYLLLDFKIIDKDKFDAIKQIADKTTNLINGFIKYLKSENNPGYKSSEPEELYLTEIIN